MNTLVFIAEIVLILLTVISAMVYGYHKGFDDGFSEGRWRALQAELDPDQPGSFS